MKKLWMLTLFLGMYVATAGKINDALPINLHMQTDTVNLEEYAGMYTFTTSGSPVSSFHVTVKDGNLYGEADSYGSNKLLKQTEADKFVSTSSYGSTILFLRNTETKKVNGLQLIIQGNTLEATKDK